MKKLGFGCMRLPLRDADVQKDVDMGQVCQMVDTFLQRGFTYFDTAYMYHDYESERVVREALVKRHARGSFTLATKMPMRLLNAAEEQPRIFDEQLEKCGVDYFDYYLLHALSVDNYKKACEMDTFGFLAEKKAQGKIRNLGFSFHDTAAVLDEILTAHPEVDFVQLQLNYLDWDSESIQSRKCYETAQKHGKPVVVMEPVRGGKLAALDADSEQRLRAIRPGASAASFALRWLEGHGNIRMILSGMSTMEQVKDNIATFEKDDPVTPEEEAILLAAAEKMKNSVPCTACRYCCDGCPQGLDIPDLLHKYNQLRAGSGSTIKMQLDAVPEDKWPHACLCCGACAAVCPQKIAIPDELAAFAAQLDKLPTWVEVCRQRAEAEARERASRGR